MPPQPCEKSTGVTDADGRVTDRDVLCCICEEKKGVRSLCEMCLVGQTAASCVSCRTAAQRMVCEENSVQSESAAGTADWCWLTALPADHCCLCGDSEWPCCFARFLCHERPDAIFMLIFLLAAAATLCFH